MFTRQHQKRASKHVPVCPRGRLPFAQMLIPAIRCRRGRASITESGRASLGRRQAVLRAILPCAAPRPNSRPALRRYCV
ncbi:hypothetical protein E2C01_070201 [Portunus trituberculatus]|uniref:Uncharacterized protein n=1 Tax=Portunus trituberculatus TaxID=210409 RepID=A0A5B7I4T6_PORTR|nr:hypothetical protein [Portunus trituberculatus]